MCRGDTKRPAQNERGQVIRLPKIDYDFLHVFYIFVTLTTNVTRGEVAVAVTKLELLFNTL